MTIMMQKPDATMCQSFTGWKEMGRFVKKGEKGIRVMASAPYKMEREQDKIDADGKPVLDKDGEPVKEILNLLYDFQKDAALAVVKYYENRNKTVLVLCPKKLAEKDDFLFINS